MNNVIIRKVKLTNQFQRLATTKVVGNFRFRAAATGTVITLQATPAIGQMLEPIASGTMKHASPTLAA